MRTTDHGRAAAQPRGRSIGLLATLLAASIAVPASIAAAPTFESHWQDGKAELDGYRYTVTRYGRPRSGTAVMIFVTEPFSESKRVKVDSPKANPKDTFEALKLNFIRDFQTGIYDYNTMTSLFVRSRDFSPAKISFSSAEWCGHVYEEMTFGAWGITDRYASYFEGESGERRLNRMKDGVTEEELFIRLRGLRGEWLRPGERRSLPFLASSFYRRLTHRPLRWTTAVVERSAGNETIAVGAGRFEASVATVATGDGRDGRFWIEAAYPHRILKWAWNATARKVGDGWNPSEGTDSAELTGSARLPYWRLHNEGDERYVKDLGLTVGPGGVTSRAGGAKSGGRR